MRDNDLPLLELHSDFVTRMKILVDKHTAEALHKMTLESTGTTNGFGKLCSRSEIVTQTPLITDPAAVVPIKGMNLINCPNHLCSV